MNDMIGDQSHKLMSRGRLDVKLVVITRRSRGEEAAQWKVRCDVMW